jgi:uncharacterized protein (TIGR02270 family)
LAHFSLDFHDLLAADDQLQAALESLVLLGDPARTHMEALLDAPLRRGETFALALYALQTHNERLLDACRGLGIALPELRDSLMGAIAWAPASPLLLKCIDALPIPDRLRALGLRHRDFDGVVEQTLAWLRTVMPEPGIIEASLSFVRNVGDSHLAGAASRYLDHEAATARLAAAQTLLTLAEAKYAAEALEALALLATGEDAASRDGAVRCLAVHNPLASPGLIADLAGRPDQVRLHLLALGWAGKIDAVPVLVSHLDNPDACRVAGASLSLITGSDPARDGWQGERASPPSFPDNGAEIPARDIDKNLPWPDRDGFVSWWKTNRGRFDPAQRHFAGRPIEVGWLITVLTTGPLAWRTLAAEHLQRLTHTPLFPTTLPAAAQRTLFPTLTEAIQ